MAAASCRGPGHELEAEAVIDHGEAAGGEREALPVGSGDILPGRGGIERLTRLRSESLAQGFDLAAPERADQILGEDDSLRPALGKPLLDELLGPALHRVTDFGAKAGLAERHRIARHGLPVEPRRAAGRHLIFDGEVRAHGQRDAPPPLRVIELAQLDDRPRRAVAGGVEIGELDVMGAAVHAVDHGVGRPLQLVVEAAIDQPADDGRVEALAGEDVARGRALDAAFRQAAMNAFDDVAALAELAQRRLRGLVHRPLARPDLMGEAEALQTP